MKILIALLLLTLSSFCEELNYIKKRTCEFSPDNYDFVTLCASVVDHDSKIIIEIKDKIFELKSNDIKETYTVFECYDEADAHICNGMNSMHDDTVLYFYNDSLVILSPEYETLVLYK